MKKKKRRKDSALEMLALEEARMAYQDVIVNMYGVDGNAFSILTAVSSALRKAGAPQRIVNFFVRQATSGAYEDLLKVCDDWVTIVNIQPRSSQTSAVTAFDTIGKNL